MGRKGHTKSILWHATCQWVQMPVLKNRLKLLKLNRNLFSKTNLEILRSDSINLCNSWNCKFYLLIFSLNIIRHSLQALPFLRPAILIHQHPTAALALHDPEHKSWTQTNDSLLNRSLWNLPCNYTSNSASVCGIREQNYSTQLE